MLLAVHGGHHLCQNLGNHVPMHIGQATLDSVVVIDQLGVVDAKQMQCGRMQVVDRKMGTGK